MNPSDKILVPFNRGEAKIWLDRDREGSLDDSIKASRHVEGQIRKALTNTENKLDSAAEALMLADGYDDVGQIFGPAPDLTPANMELRDEYRDKAAAVINSIGADL